MDGTYEEATNVALQGSIRVQFNRFLAADTANRQAFCVSNGAECITAGVGPGSVTFAVEYDPVDRVVVLKPQQALMPSTRYNVHLLPPKNEADTTGIRAFDGVPLAKDFTFAFTTGDASAMPDEPNLAVDYCSAETACKLDTDTPVQVQTSVGTQFESCAAAGCHFDNKEPLPKVLVGDALRLKDEGAGEVPGAVRRIVERRLVAPLSATDPDPGTARTSGQDSFARNMPYIDPRNPGNSFILYKMIIGMLHCPPVDKVSTDPVDKIDAVEPDVCYGDGGGYGFPAEFTEPIYAPTVAGDAGACDAGTIIHNNGDRRPYGGRSGDKLGAWVPEQEWKPPVMGEYARLRYRIRGNPMPQGSPSPPQDIHLISAWIAAGAKAVPCRP